MKTNQDKLRHYAIEVKPIGAACNLRCKYCYYLGKNSSSPITNSAEHGGLMSEEVLESYIRQVIDIHGQYAEIEFAWHGGEPTLCGIAFFERAIQLQQKYSSMPPPLRTSQILRGAGLLYIKKYKKNMGGRALATQQRRPPGLVL